MNDDELNLEELSDIKGGLSSNDLAIEEGKKSKFNNVAQMAKEAEKKQLNSQQDNDLELSEQELENISNYYNQGDDFMKKDY